MIASTNTAAKPCFMPGRPLAATIIQDRWADVFRHTRPGTNDYRANHGHQDQRIAHQVRHAERKLPWTEQVARAIAKWEQGVRV